MYKTLAGLIILAAAVTTGCRTTLLNQSSTLRDGASSTSKYTLISQKDVSSLSSKHVSFSFPNTHPLNKRLAENSSHPFGIYIYDLLAEVTGVSPGESFVESITLKTKNTNKSDSGFKSASQIPSLYVFSSDKIAALKSANSEGDITKNLSPSFISNASGYYSLTPVGPTSFHDVNIKIAPHVENDNFYFLLRGNIEISELKLTFSRNYKVAAPKLSSAGYSYDKNISCRSKSTEKELCLIGDKKPRHVILKRRFSKEPCYRTDGPTEDNKKIISSSFRVVEKDSKFYVEVMHGCQAQFGVDDSSNPNPTKENTSIFK